jgi:hypothetical protein
MSVSLLQGGDQDNAHSSSESLCPRLEHECREIMLAKLTKTRL